MPLTQQEQAGVEVALTEQVSPSDAAKMAEVGGPHFNQEIQFTLLIILFALVSLLFLYLAAKEGKATPFFLRIYLITIIVFGTLAIVASAYTTEQIAPVVGLFGTIAGYVLGKSDGSNETPAPGPS